MGRPPNQFGATLPTCHMLLMVIILPMRFFHGQRRKAKNEKDSEQDVGGAGGDDCGTAEDQEAMVALTREADCEVEASVMKSDNEPALTKVVEEIGRLSAAMRGPRVGQEPMCTRARATDSSRGRSTACRGW